jgi:hypothetical protein
MKKWIGFLLVIIIISVIAIYTLIPAELKVAGYERVSKPSGLVTRLFQMPQKVKNWWPGDQKNDSDFLYQQVHYHFTQWNPINIAFKADIDGTSVNATINAITVQMDTTNIQIEYETIKTSINPIKRIEAYLNARLLKKQLDSIAIALKRFSENEENIYDMAVVQTKVRDSSLISTKKLFQQKPTNKDIHDLVQVLKTYVAQNGGTEHDFPMLNIRETMDHQFEAMIAIPLLKDIPVKGDIIIKKMILGNILEAKVIGGPKRIADGEVAIKKYAEDFNKKSPAIPFLSLVTDRYTESDSTKWITYLKYPVF